MTKSLQRVFVLFDPLLQSLILSLEFEVSLVERLDGHEGNTIDIHGRNRDRVIPQTEGFIEILSHGSKVPNLLCLIVVAPLLNGHGCDLLKDDVGIDVLNIGLPFAIRPIGPRTTT